jgi:tRNA threonylcarbamoyladenosine biosynthesis protein TsaE
VRGPSVAGDQRTTDMIEPGEFATSSPEETEALARRIGEGIDERAVFLLVGDLGAGKTLFTRGLAAGLGVDPDDVSSPTFALVNRYDGGRLRVYHLDLYRLDGPAALGAAYELGLEEMLDERAVVVVEWAERLEGFPLPDAWRVEIVHDDSDPDARRISIG